MATATSTKPAVVGVFHDQSNAQKAVNQLRSAGFAESEIGMITQKGAHDTTIAHDGKGAHDGDGTNAAEGAAVGAATGVGVGALWALGIAAGILPAIGPAIAGGILASILTSAASGAAVGGLVGALVGLGIPEEEAKHYESEVKSGRTIVTVASATREAEAIEILTRNGGDVRNARGSTNAPHFQGKNRFASTESKSFGRETSNLKDTDACKIPAENKAVGSTVDLKKEEVHARKSNEQVGEVRIHKDVVTEHKTMEVPVTREEVVIERRPASGKAGTLNQVAPGEEIRIPVKEERVHIDKETVVDEQVSVGKRHVTSTAKVGADVKREELRVEKTGEVPVKETPATKPR
jgi:uncharacterized protein (TIGR02271 family)